MTTDILSNLTHPGERLKYIRDYMLRVSRSYITEKYHVPQVTLKAWELGTTKISITNLQKCIEIYRSEGLIISQDWVLYGKGLEPVSVSVVNNYFSNPSDEEIASEDDEILMLQDLNMFKQNRVNVLTMMVSSDEMRPFYKPGDYIGGKMRDLALINDLANKDCIVILTSGAQIFRRLFINMAGQYNLTCLNPNENTAEPVLFNVEIQKIAPVVWHRWKDE